MKKVIEINPFLLFFVLFISLVPYPSTAGNILSAAGHSFLAVYLYCIAGGLFKKLPQTHQLNLSLFYFNLACSAAFFILKSVFHASFPVTYASFYDARWSLALISPILFFGYFATFYCLYWLAKCVATIKFGAGITFTSFAPYFFLMCVFPIGLFWILPIIKNILSQDQTISIAAQPGN